MTSEAYKDLAQKIEAMAPWHHNILLRGDVRTIAEQKADATGANVTQVDADASFKKATGPILPNGMEGRSFLDCACNCGGYSFAAKSAGAGDVYGFDVRDHWIDQAKFVLEHREADCSGMVFEVADLSALASHEESYDVTWFSGIFYHLPDPIAGLKLAADRTNELLFLNTACMPLAPGKPEVPSLQYKTEGTEQLMSGVYGPSWLPSGPIVLKEILGWLGFPEARTYMWVERNQQSGRRSGRVAVVGAREAGRLDNMDDIARPTDLDSRRRT